MDGRGGLGVRWRWFEGRALSSARIGVAPDSFGVALSQRLPMVDGVERGVADPRFGGVAVVGRGDRCDPARARPDAASATLSIRMGAARELVAHRNRDSAG